MPTDYDFAGVFQIFKQSIYPQSFTSFCNELTFKILYNINPTENSNFTNFFYNVYNFIMFIIL